VRFQLITWVIESPPAYTSDTQAFRMRIFPVPRSVSPPRSQVQTHPSCAETTEIRCGRNIGTDMPHSRAPAIHSTPDEINAQLIY
jgi:hypothetical protein